MSLKQGKRYKKMRVDVVPPRELLPCHLTRWDQMQAAHPALTSPYLCHQFVQAVGRVRSDALVAVMEVDGEVVGFLPFQRHRSGLGLPIGGRLSDVQAVIGRHLDWCRMTDLLKPCGVSAFAFTNLRAEPMPSAVSVRRLDPSYCIDLGEGYDAYAAERRRVGSRIIVDAERKARRLSREVGSLRFVPNDVAPATFRQLLDWKNAQFRRTGTHSPFSLGWIRELVDDLRQISGSTFGGTLSALWAGDTLLAVHFGIRSKKTWHYWFPTYNTAYDAYSPGLILIQQMAAHANELGVDTIELGKGDYLFKQRFSTSTIGVARAVVGPRSPLVTALRFREIVQRHAARWHLPLVASGLEKISRRFERLVLS